jgi:predicted TIM-barrel fold metal-dependent hydrolase
MTSAWVKTIVEALGSDRVAFGSDFVFIDIRSSLGRVVLADLPEDDIAMVLGGTSARLFGFV